MTDRGEEALRLSAQKITIGPSAMSWGPDGLTIDIDERTTPHIGKLQGRVTITPEAVTDVELPLTRDGAHIWRPFAPVSRIKVDLNRSGWSWDGHGYFDANFGTRALEADFSYWTWGRYPTTDGAVCFYDADRRADEPLATGIAFSRSGKVTQIAPPPKTSMRRTNWLVRRETRADQGAPQPRQVKAMLDAPFYSRSCVETVINGERTIGVHEALDCNRFASNWLMPMLAVRVPRRKRWRF